MNTFPEIIHAQRTELRRYALEDVSSLLGIVTRNRDDLLESFPKTVSALCAPGDVPRFFAEKNQLWEQRKTFCFGLWLKGEGIQVGQVQVRNVDWDVPSAELGYFIDSTYRNKGLATDGLRAILGACFSSLHFKRIAARILPSNRQSVALIEKLGFQAEGIHRNEFRSGKGELLDITHYSMTDSDFTTRLNRSIGR